MNKSIDKKCAPSKTFKDGSCFTHQAISKIIKEYNKIHNTNINHNLPKYDLVKFLNKKFSNLCDNQTCWLKLKFLQQLEDDDIMNDTFRPEGPIKKYEWLSTSHINDVITQYQSVHDDFIFLGAVPYDFAELEFLKFYNINFNELLKNGKSRIGIVINLDNHNQSGSHWVGLYFDLIKYQIYFFDSVGNPPGKKIRKFINKIILFMHKKIHGSKLNLNKLIDFKRISKDKWNSILKSDNQLNETLIKLTGNHIDIQYNNVQHQFKNTECGVYSIHFILGLVEGKTFKDVSHRVIKDDEMNKYRQVYFR